MLILIKYAIKYFMILFSLNKSPHSIIFQNNLDDVINYVTKTWAIQQTLHKMQGLFIRTFDLYRTSGTHNIREEDRTRNRHL